MARVSDERARWLAQHVLPHEPALRAWIRGRRIGGVDPDDVVQETYARLAGLDTVEGVRNAKAYAFQIAHSVILTQLRRARVVSIKAVADVDALGGVSSQPTPEEAVVARDELIRLAEALASLPARVGDVLRLRRIDDLSQRQVAERLGIAESTVEKHMAKGIRLLMDFYGRGGIAPARASRHGMRESWEDEASERETSDGNGQAG